ncbi:MAG: hypothetical protein IPK33_24005 [Gemmatimonadetes bacterium]|nr:hypothetical protein [Gemmatimonadota bacterium]
MLGRYVRERHVLSLEDAVRKMTSFPAARLRAAGSWARARGMAADLTIFDAAAIIDRSTFTSPHHCRKACATSW